MLATQSSFDLKHYPQLVILNFLLLGGILANVLHQISLRPNTLTVAQKGRAEDLPILLTPE